MNTCGMSDPTNHLLAAGYEGVYDCNDGSWWLSNGAACCPRALEASGACTVNATNPACIAVIVDDPSYDAGFNEALVASIGSVAARRPEGSTRT